MRYVDDRNLRAGALWEGRFKSCLVDSETRLLRRYRNIELNPARAGAVLLPSEYRWSSFACNALGPTTRRSENRPHRPAKK